MKYSWNKKHRFLHEISDNIFQLLDYLKSEDNGKYLYRGQNRAYGDVARQVPGIYRSCKSIEEAVSYRKRSQLQAAWLFDQVRLIPPSSKWKLLPLYLGNLDEPNNLAAVLAIAQHYGIATDYIDLTNLGPSAIFATQEWKPIAYARKYFSGHIFPIEGDDLGFIYRYNMESLNSYGIIVGDISTGFFGARPLLHEGKTYCGTSINK